MIRLAAGFTRFLCDFVVGDDWRIAAGVGAVLAAGALLVARTDLSHTVITLLAGGGIVGVAGAAVVLGARRAAGRG